MYAQHKLYAALLNCFTSRRSMTVTTETQKLKKLLDVLKVAQQTESC